MIHLGGFGRVLCLRIRAGGSLIWRWGMGSSDRRIRRLVYEIISPGRLSRLCLCNCGADAVVIMPPRMDQRDRLFSSYFFILSCSDHICTGTRGLGP